MFSIIFDHANACASMHSLVEIHIKTESMPAFVAESCERDLTSHNGLITICLDSWFSIFSAIEIQASVPARMDDTSFSLFNSCVESFIWEVIKNYKEV